MGGYGHLIPIEPSDELLEAARNPKQPLLSRLFKRPASGDSSGQPAFPELIELPLAKRFKKALLQNFLGFLEAEIAKPWVATQSFCKNYLRAFTHGVYVRGQQDKSGDPHYYYVQLSFSDCAGMAGTSSSLAAHWAEIWHQRNREMIEEDFLQPHGLTPVVNPRLECEQEDLFLPAGEYGYAGYWSEERLAGVHDPQEQPFHFDVDAYWSEALYAEMDDRDASEFPVPEVVQFLEQGYVSLMSDGQCRCQMCMPDLDVGKLDQIKVG